MKSRFSIVVMLLVFAAQSLGSASRGPLYQADVSSDEYAVYNAVIGDMFAGNKITFDFGGNVPMKLLIIYDHTVTYPLRDVGGSDAAANAFFPAIAQQTADDFAVKNKQASLLKRSFNLNLDYILWNSEDPKGAALEKGDGEVHGLVSLSRVGFNRDHNQADVYMSYVCGGLCGHGFVLLLSKSGDQWKVVNKRRLWVS